MQIGAHLIARNEPDNIINCLDSCNGLVDYFVVAVDSGPESDETYNLIKDRENTFVYRQDWPNSFADARNDSLKVLLEKYPNIDYILWVDGDDYWSSNRAISISHEEVRKRLEEQRPGAVNNIYTYGNDDNNNSSLSYYRLRLFAHTPGTSPTYTWEGSAHETLVCQKASCGITVSWNDWVLIHKKSENIDWKAKTGRNIQMLELDVAKNPDNTRSLFYLAREHKDLGHTEKAIVSFMKYVNKSNFNLEKYQALLDLTELFQRNNDLYSAEMSARQAIELIPEVAFAPNMLGEIYMKKNRPDLARMYFAMAAYAPHGAVLFDYIPYRTYIPQRWLSVACMYSGMQEEAIKHHQIAKKIAPNDGGLKFNDPWLIDNSKEFPSELNFLCAFDENFNEVSTLDEFLTKSLPHFTYILGDAFDIEVVDQTTCLDSLPTKTIYINERLTSELLLLTESVFLSKEPIAIIVKDFGDWAIKNVVANYLQQNAKVQLYRNFELNKKNSSLNKNEGIGILIRTN